MEIKISPEKIFYISLKIFFVVVLSYLAIYFFSFLLDKIFLKIGKSKFKDDINLKKKTFTLTSLLKSCLKFFVYFSAGAIILKEIGFDITPLIAGAGLAGFAIGFGAQTLIKDLINGFFIILENQFAIGDKVTIGGLTGIVEEITIRYTKIRGENNALHIIPNGNISNVTNYGVEKFPLEEKCS
jgi:small conductance mechanosensitive channel